MQTAIKEAVILLLPYNRQQVFHCWFGSGMAWRTTKIADYEQLTQDSSKHWHLTHVELSHSVVTLAEHLKTDTWSQKSKLSCIFLVTKQVLAESGWCKFIPILLQWLQNRLSCVSLGLGKGLVLRWVFEAIPVSLSSNVILNSNHRKNFSAPVPSWLACTREPVRGQA